jgi:hypothetical protein
MSACVGVGQREIRMSNGSWELVVENVLVVAREKARTDLHRSSIARLDEEQKAFYPGYNPDFERLFPTHEERAFWAMCFRDVGRWLCIGKLPNQLWGGSPALCVFYTYWCAELLSGLLRNAKIDFDYAAYWDEDTQLRVQAREEEMRRIQSSARGPEEGQSAGDTIEE